MNNIERKSIDLSEGEKQFMNYNDNFQNKEYNQDENVNYYNEEENYLTFAKNEEVKKEPIYIMTIELEKGISDIIQIYNDSSSQELAFEFCKKNNLNLKAMQFLSSEINKLKKMTIQNGSIQEESEEELGKDKSVNSVIHNNQPISQNQIDERNNYNFQNIESGKKIGNKDYKNVQILDKFINVENKSNSYIPNFSKIPDFEQNFQQFAFKDNNESSFCVNKESTIAPYYNSDFSLKRYEDNSNIKSKNNNNIYITNDKVNFIKTESQKKVNEPEISQNLDNSDIQKSLKNSLNKNILKNDSNITNKFKRSKNNESPENLRTEPIDINQSFESNKSCMNDKINQQIINRDFNDKNNNFLKNNFNKNTTDINENSFNISNNLNDSNKNKKINQTYTNFNKSTNSRTLFNYDTFFNNIKKKTENTKETTSVNKNNFKETHKIDIPEKVLENIDNRIEKEMRAKTNAKKCPEKVPLHQYINIGERLYVKGIHCKENKTRKLNELKENINRDINKNLTFKPRINKSPFFKSEKNITNKCDSCHLNKSGNLGKSLNRSLEKCSFKPEIDKYSEEISRQKFLAKIKKVNPTKEEVKNFRINELYNQAKNRQKIIRKLDEQIYGNYNFTPNFNTNYIVESNFNERLEYFRNKSEEKIKRMENDQKKKHQNENGQKFFTPKLISKQIKRENTSDIFNYMYSFAKRYNSNKNLKYTEETIKIKLNSCSIHTTNDSENILNKLKIQNFEKIFELLDSDQDDIISKFAIDLKKIPGNIKEIYQMIFREIIEDDQTLNKEEFLLASDQLYEMMDFEERKIILNFIKDFNKSKKKQPTQTFTFKPSINKNSKKIDESLPYYISKSQTNSILMNNRSIYI